MAIKLHGLPNGIVGVPYGRDVSGGTRTTCKARGGVPPYTYELVSGTPPITDGGYELDPDTGDYPAAYLRGMSPATGGSFTFVVRATDSEEQTGEREYTIIIEPNLVQKPEVECMDSGSGS